MKINSNLTLLGLFFGFIYLLFNQWSNSHLQYLTSYSNYSPKAIGHINLELQKDVQIFVNQTANFKFFINKIESSNSRDSKKLLEQEYRKLRHAFKSIEFILEYLDKEAYDKILNGAPLPKLEKKVADITILEPHGMQVIDELVGAYTGSSDEKIILIEEVTIFDTNVKKLHSYFEQRKLTDRQFFEASRQSIIRLASLGITGFDTPGTLSGIDDAKIVLKALKKYIKLYEPELINIDHIQLLDHILSLLNKGIQDTNNIDFDHFDRLAFIKDVVNPTYKVIKDIHLALNYETIDEVSRYIQAINYDADNLFDKDFLNNFYYVSLSKDSTYRAKSELGKLLFYDPILSQNNSISCATCHNPDKGFTDGKTLSLSNKGSTLKRNAMTLNYSVYATRYFHDLRAKRLEDQFEHVVLSEDEFNSSYKEILNKLRNSPTYVSLFEKAFPNKNKIRFNDIDYALAAYVMKLNTFDSKIDKYLRNEITELPDNVERGFNLFSGKAACATCHFTPLFSGNLPPLFIDSEAEVLGVPEHKAEPWTLDDDLGRVGNGVTQDQAIFYEAAFKTPTIRNIDLTGPYMHNGVFDSLEEVMDFYNKGGGAGNGIELKHQTLASEPLNLTDKEIADIIAFMKSLNDTKVFQRPESIPRDFPDKNINQRVF